MNPNTPVLVGAAQLLQRIDKPLSGDEPIDMMLQVLHAAAADAGAPSLLEQADSIRVIKGIWRYENPASWLAERLDLPGIETVGTPFGGNSVQSMVNRSAQDILAGRNRIVLITGAENGNSQAKARKAGLKVSWRETPGDFDWVLGEEKMMASDAEMARGIRRPIEIYPIFENAIRFHRGESIEAHIRRVSELWSRFSEVASNNPNAWIREKVDAETIRTASAANRMVSFPYPKLMNSNNAVDMAAALIMCPVELARSLGIPEEKWIYPWAGTDAHDHYMLSHRDNLYSSPAIRFAGRRVMELARVSQDDLAYVDIYSCFPSAVQVAAEELGFSEDRDLTVTGGLTFGGGPLNNYVMHSIARMVELLREDRGEKGLITANGGYLTKHAFGIYSAEAPAQDFQYENLQAQVDLEPSRESLIDYEGEVMIESYTVMFGVEGPTVAHAACLTADGKRTWASTTEAAVMAAMQVEEFCGCRGQIDGQGKLTV